MNILNFETASKVQLVSRLVVSKASNSGHSPGVSRNIIALLKFDNFRGPTCSSPTATETSMFVVGFATLILYVLAEQCKRRAQAVSYSLKRADQEEGETWRVFWATMHNIPKTIIG